MLKTDSPTQAFIPKNDYENLKDKIKELERRETGLALEIDTERKKYENLKKLTARDRDGSIIIELVEDLEYYKQENAECRDKSLSRLKMIEKYQKIILSLKNKKKVNKGIRLRHRIFLLRHRIFMLRHLIFKLKKGALNLWVKSVGRRTPKRN